MKSEKPERYAPLLVTIHWLTVILLGMVFALGLATRYLPPENWQAYVGLHMPLGISVLAVTLVRIVVRSRTEHPEPATTGSDLLDKVGVATHHLLYLLAVVMPISGMLLSISYGISPIQSEFIQGLRWVPIAHRIIAPAFGLVIVLHIGAAFFHQLIKKDNLLARMWYGGKE
jgi:cytochrome b561